MRRRIPTTSAKISTPGAFYTLIAYFCLTHLFRYVADRISALSLPLVNFILRTDDNIFG
jgi:hypothetical protein